MRMRMTFVGSVISTMTMIITEVQLMGNFHYIHLMLFILQRISYISEMHRIFAKYILLEHQLFDNDTTIISVVFQEFITI